MNTKRKNRPEERDKNVVDIPKLGIVRVDANGAIEYT
jgi:hypothetical protein